MVFGLALVAAPGLSREAFSLRVWRDYAEQVEGMALDCGHFLPEEAPEAVCKELIRFFASPPGCVDIQA